MDDDNICKLAKLAAGRANLLQARQSARACGDWKYLEETDEAMAEYEEKFTMLRSQMSDRDIDKARDFTNAPI